MHVQWTFDSANIGGNTDYDISNIQGFSVAQSIIPDSGITVTCTSVDCACDQAYRPGDTSGTCGGTGPVDQATRVSSSPGYVHGSVSAIHWLADNTLFMLFTVIALEPGTV
ncbi:hypothetical protein K438DRAFT_1971799 [Mycena galopus ATCC 62051]|nr:hypothetical protein K438DRAFT_1971799 [Mycena galopus ATCC 62051]